jgi:hypothetical protein
MCSPGGIDRWSLKRNSYGVKEGEHTVTLPAAAVSAPAQALKCSARMLIIIKINTIILKQGRLI